MPTETAIVTWTVLPWKEEMSREELLAVQIRQLEGRPEDVADAVRRQQEAWFRSKYQFDKKHRLQPQKIEETDWMIVYNNSLDHQHNLIWKFTKRWFRPYEVWKVFNNGTYRLCELDGTLLRLPIEGTWVKIFKKRTNVELYVTLDNTNTKEQSDKDHEGAESEESGMKLIIDIGGETENATD